MGLELEVIVWQHVDTSESVLALVIGVISAAVFANTLEEHWWSTGLSSRGLVELKPALKGAFKSFRSSFSAKKASQRASGLFDAYWRLGENYDLKNRIIFSDWDPAPTTSSYRCPSLNT